MEKEKNGNSCMLAIKTSKVSSYVLGLVFVLAFAYPSASNIFPGFIKWHVFIVDDLSNNQNLLCHCKSEDDDLGIQTLAQGSNITWSFRTDFTHSTLFWCHVRKDNASARFNVFWYDEHLFKKCDWKNCIWSVRDDGIYLREGHEMNDELYYHWDDCGCNCD